MTQKWDARMDVITRRFQRDPYKGPREYQVYTQEEADEAGIEYVEDWVEAEPGQYALTDDKWVALLCFKTAMRSKYPHIQPYYLTFSFCRAIVKLNITGKPRSRPKLLYEPFRGEKIMRNAVRPMTWVEEELSKARGKRAIEAYAQRFVEKKGKKLTREDWDDIAEHYRPSAQIPRASVRFFFRNKEVQKVAAARVQEVLADRGISIGAVLDVYKSAIKLAQEQGQPKVMIEGADRLRDIIEQSASNEAEDGEYTLESGDADPKIFERKDRPKLAEKQEGGEKEDDGGD